MSGEEGGGYRLYKLLYALFLTAKRGRETASTKRILSYTRCLGTNNYSHFERVHTCRGHIRSKRFFTVLFRDTIRDINDEFISYNVSFIICEDIKNMGFKGLVIKFFVKIFDIRRILLIILRSFMILPSFKS